ncbi:hypothetical protein [Streptomyces sp. RK75]|uniref:hypothetical protein n=1 Tax=Streptomyces sp. RK75 TaxID=2824895 RepID=UPI001B367013|nr:hypothetical protein [Streptomyces sp. RK75]MBQ0863383.1 hypothetical protein [Streptomyces sp. RK75]
MNVEESREGSGIRLSPAWIDQSFIAGKTPDEVLRPILELLDTDPELHDALIDAYWSHPRIQGLHAGYRKNPPYGSFAPPAHGGNLTGLIRTMLNAQEGNRNNTLMWCACRAYEAILAGAVPEHNAVGALTEAAEHAGLGRDEIASTLRSARNAVAQEPGS